MEEITASAATTEVEATEQSAPETANVFAFGPDDLGGGDHEFGDVADQAGEEAPEPEANSGSGDEPPEGGADQQPEEEDKQKKIGHAFAVQSKKLEKRYKSMLENDPDRQIGRRMVEDLMIRNGLTEEQAREETYNRLAKAYATRENVGEGVAKDIESIKRQLSRNQAPEPDNEEFDVATKAEEVKADIAAMDLPDGFDPDAAYADPAFSELLMEMPTKAAVRVYMAERKASTAEQRAAKAPQDIAEKLRARQKIPQAERPQAPARPQVNYNAMSDDEFLAEKERRARMNR